MREIKFRAWHKNGEMIYFDNKDLMRDKYQCAELAKLMNGGYGDVLNQFVGLKDKNGIEIYENDILVSKSGSGVVVWSSDNACWSCKFAHDDEKYGLLEHCDEAVEHCEIGEIVGNIYENPELLKNKEQE